MLATRIGSPFPARMSFPDVEPEILESEAASDWCDQAQTTSQSLWHDFIGALLPAVTNDLKPLQTPRRFLLFRNQGDAVDWATADGTANV